MVELIAVIIIIIAVLLTFILLNYILLTYIAGKFYTPPYPPNIRGSIDSVPDFDELIKDNQPWSKKLKVKLWNPKNQKEFTGNTILFSHGWDSSMAFFGSQIEHFINNNWRVVAMDLRSMGESEYVKFSTAMNFADDIGFVVRWIRDSYQDTNRLTVYCHSISGVSLLIGQGVGIINHSLIDRFVIEGIYANGRYITERFFKQFHIPQLLQRFFLIILFRKFRTCLPEDHPYHHSLHTLSNQHPINHLQNLNASNKPLIMIHTKNDQVVPYFEFEKYLEIDLPNISFLSFEDGGHFKLAKQKDYFERLEEVFNLTDY
ncbi:MAG: alpha/beta hydrolase [Candidatus Kariarchaeaceae archaeon]